MYVYVETYDSRLLYKTNKQGSMMPSSHHVEAV